MIRDVRERFLQTVIRYRLNPDEAGSTKYWSPELDTIPSAALHEIQSEKLVAVVRYLYERSPFYRAKFDANKLKPKDITSIDDLWKIPVTTASELAQDVAENPPWGTYSPIDETLWTQRGWMLFTSSSATSVRLPFRYTLFDRDMWRWAFARVLWTIGVRPGDKAVPAFAGGLSSVLWGASLGFHHVGIPVMAEGAMDAELQVYSIRTFQPTVLVATPSVCLQLAQWIQRKGDDPAKTAIRLIITYGEASACDPTTKRLVESQWDAMMHELYAFTAGAPSAGGGVCRVEAKKEQPGAHLLEDCQIWEAVDPVTFEPTTAEGCGMVVATNLISEGAPLLRFVVGDHAMFSRTRCACGMTHVRAVRSLQTEGMLLEVDERAKAVD